MGHWNKTCSLSKMHVFAGDPVYTFVIGQNLKHEHCLFYRVLESSTNTI